MVCSCAGFLGSLILFDLLTNQKAGPEEDERSPGVRAPRGTRGTDPKIHGRKSVSEKLDPCRLCSQGSRTTPSSGGAEEVKEILQKLELSEYCDVFEKERMDPQALVRGSPGLSLALPLHLLPSPSTLCASSWDRVPRTCSRVTENRSTSLGTRRSAPVLITALLIFQFLCTERNLKEMGIPLGPRMKILHYISSKTEMQVCVHGGHIPSLSDEDAEHLRAAAVRGGHRAGDMSPMACRGDGGAGGLVNGGGDAIRDASERGWSGTGLPRFGRTGVRAVCRGRVGRATAGGWAVPLSRSRQWDCCCVPTGPERSGSRDRVPVTARPRRHGRRQRLPIPRRWPGTGNGRDQPCALTAATRRW